MLRITKFNFYLGTVLFFVLFNLAQLISGENNVIRLTIVCLYVFYVPGYLVTSILRINTVNFVEKIPIRVGLSIFILYVSGLITNWSLPLFGVEKPLQDVNILTGYNGINILLLTAAYITDTVREKTLRFNKISGVDYLYAVFSLLLPLISIIGAIQLNNHESGLITFGMLGYIGFYILLLAWVKDRISPVLLAWSIFMIGTATLFMLSMRSSYIAGFDISQEYFVFQLTKNFQIWSFSTFRNAYNACLSITILPTMLSYFTNLSDQYIYKFIYPVLFSFTPVCLFFLAHKITLNRFVSFLSAIFFISQVWFVDPMVTLARQEIALLFFSLIMLVLFNRDIPTVKKHILLMIFGASLVVSHYSTTYITLLLIMSTFLGSWLFRLAWKERAQKYHFNLTTIYIVFLLGFSFVWYTQVTKSATNIGDFLNKTAKSIQSISHTDSKSTIVEQVLKGSVKIDSETYRTFYENKRKEYAKRTDLDRYTSSTYKDFKLVPKAALSLPVRHTILYSVATNVYRIVILSIQIFLVAGLVCLYFINTKLFKKDQFEYMIFVFGGIVLLVCMVGIPYVSQAYNFDRMYMQVMILTAPVIISGGYALCGRLLGNKSRVLMVTGLLILTYWYSYGFIWQVTGGKTVVWLNNFGFYYDIGYTHTTDVEAARWLEKRYDFKPVYTYATGRNILWAYARIDNVIGDVLPFAIDKFSYVFATHANVVNKINYFYYRGSHLGYEYPWQFINDNKNKIYTNGSSEIYQ